jgi:hypothetical protein
LTDSYQQAYESSQVEYQKTVMEVQSLEKTIALLKSQFKFSLQQTYNQKLATVCATDETNEQNRVTLLTSNFLMTRIWAVINRLLSTTMQAASYLFDSDKHNTKYKEDLSFIHYCIISMREREQLE